MNLKGEKRKIKKFDNNKFAVFSLFGENVNG